MPFLSITERYSDNVALAVPSAAISDWVTDAAAGLGLVYRAARASAQLDYRVNRLFHSKVSGLDSTQQFLNSGANFEAVEKWLFIDARADITQGNRSAFGPTDIAGVTGTSANRVETTTFQVAPNIRGPIKDLATYSLRMNAVETRARESAFPDSRSYLWTGFVKNARSAGRFGWSVTGGSLSVENDAIGKREDARVAGALTFEVDPQLHLSVSAGKESSDLDGQEKSVTNTGGVGLEWSPGPRTQLAAVTQTRFFGKDHLITITHRTPLTAWRFASIKEPAFASDGGSASNPFSVSNLMQDLLASSIPDPVARAEAVQQRLEQTGVPTSSGILSGTLTSRPFLSTRQDASVVLLGSRNTVTMALGQREQRALDGNTITPGGGAPIEEYRQQSANLAWAYRLTPVSTLTLVLSYLHTVDLYIDSRKTTERFQSLFFATRLGPHMSFSLGMERVQFDTTLATRNSYRENAFASSLSFRF